MSNFIEINLKIIKLQKKLKKYTYLILKKHKIMVKLILKTRSGCLKITSGFGPGIAVPEPKTRILPILFGCYCFSNCIDFLFKLKK